MYRFTLIMLLFFLSAFQPLPTLTVEQCLTDNGDSSTVLDHPELAALSGVSVGSAYPEILRSTEAVGNAGVSTDTGERRLQWRVGGGQLYLFVFRDKEAPGAYYEVAPGVWNWHGACMIRVTG